MKQFLLSGLLIIATFFGYAQPANFDDGAGLEGWSTTADLSIVPYSASPNCQVVNPGGLVIAPIPGEPIHILSPVLGPINNDEVVSLAFNFFTFSGSGAFDCQTQQNSTCATMRIYVVDASYNDVENVPGPSLIYGEKTVTNLATGQQRIDVPIASSTPNASAFKVLLAADLSGCGSLAYIVDDVLLQVIDPIVTPVSFKSFTAVRNRSAVALNWITASEQNNRGFYVQKNEGNGWKDVAFVFSQAEGGNSAVDLEYAYNDVNISKGITQYRLLQVDIDGKAKLSEIRSVKGEGLAARVLVYPNPSNTGSVNVVFDSQSSRDVQVSDISGRLVKRYSGVVNNLKVEGLRAGVYTLRIADRANGSIIVEKVVVK